VQASFYYIVSHKGNFKVRSVYESFVLMFIGKQLKKTPRKTFPFMTASQRIMIQI